MTNGFRFFLNTLCPFHTIGSLSISPTSQNRAMLARFHRIPCLDFQNHRVLLELDSISSLCYFLTTEQTTIKYCSSFDTVLRTINKTIMKLFLKKLGHNSLSNYADKTTFKTEEPTGHLNSAY